MIIEQLQDITLIHGDCLPFMRTLPDKAFSLAIVDPEFGIGISKSPRLVTDKGEKAKEWDNKPVDASYFKELFRVSENQIIWGGNYFELPANKHCLIWDKVQPETLSFGMFDYAWTSFNGSNKIFRYSVQLEKDKIHECQKPVQLYKWLLKNYAKEGDTILDTHLGSGSSAIAAHDGHFKFTGIELDADYYEAAKKRIAFNQRQQNLF